MFNRKGANQSFDQCAREQQPESESVQTKQYKQNDYQVFHSDLAVNAKL